MLLEDSSFHRCAVDALCLAILANGDAQDASLPECIAKACLESDHIVTMRMADMSHQLNG